MVQFTQLQTNLINLILFVVQIIVNFLVLSDIFKVSKKAKTQFNATKHAPCLWYTVYFFQLVYLIYSFVAKVKNSKQYIQAIGIWFGLTCFLNIIGFVSYSLKLLGLSIIFYFLLAIVLAWVYYNLQKIQKTYVNLSTSVNYICAELLIYIYLAWSVIVTVTLIFAAHKFHTGRNTCDCSVMFAIIALTVVYIIVGGWRKEPVCLFVLSSVLCATAHPTVKKGAKLHPKVTTTACVCLYISFVLAVVITVYNLYLIVKDYVKSYKESRQILVKQ